MLKKKKRNVLDTIQITWYMENYEILNLFWKGQSTDANDEIIQMVELFDKDFKTGIINMLKGAIMSAFWNKVKMES